MRLAARMISTEKRDGVFPFQAEDMEWILASGVKEFGLKFYKSEALSEIARTREENGQCVTGWVDGKIVGVGGIDEMWPGVGEVWLLVSYEVNNFPVRAYKTIRKGLKKLIDDNNLHRCQAWGRADYAEACSLFRHLGFTPEGIAEKYMPDGTDAILFAKVKQC